MKFGDIVINDWAGDRNPHKVLMVVKVTNRRVRCLATDGDAAEFTNDEDLRLRHVATLDMTEWNGLAKAFMDRGNAARVKRDTSGRTSVGDGE